MALACTIQPLSAFLSTNLNSKIETYDRLGDRIKRSLGYPLVSLEIHTDQLRENIQIAVEYFTKYAGFTREYLIFDSDMYEKNKGIRLDLLYTLANTNLTTSARKVAGTNPLGPGPEFIGSTPESVYVRIHRKHIPHEIRDEYHLIQEHICCWLLPLVHYHQILSAHLR